MLFNYPIAATVDNWISSTLLDSLRVGLHGLQEDQDYPNFHDVIPDLYKSEFARGKKFTQLYNDFLDLCRPLNAQMRAAILVALDGQNKFPAVFEATAICPTIAVTLPEIHEAARNLFEYAFGKLSDLKTPGSDETVRARYHDLVHASLENGCCPFCGLEIIEAPDPDLVDPDLDHYLAVSRYPFAGANLRNLTAMGTTCNRSYKGAKDILLDELDNKSDCIDPYGDEKVELDLAGTTLLPGGGDGPRWSLNFNPDIRSKNWRRVFNLERRLTSNVLEKQWQTWLRHFVNYSKENAIDISNQEGMRKAAKRFRLTCSQETLPAVARLKANFFQLIEEDLGDAVSGPRLHNFVLSV